MLKVINLLFALSLGSALSIIWQLPNQAQSNSPSKSTAGTDSGAATGASQTGIFAVPSTGVNITIPVIPGISPNITTGVSTGGSIPVSGTTVPPKNIEPNSPNINVGIGGIGSGATIIAPPAVQNNVNNVAGNIIKPPAVPSGQPTQVSIIVIIIQQGPGASAAVTQLQNTFVSFGVPQASVQALVTALRGLVGNRSASLPNLPVAQGTPGQLLASNKALKPISIIAQSDAAPNVDINKLNDAIVAYNGIILASDAETLRKLSKDNDFRSIGKILRELRDAIN